MRGKVWLLSGFLAALAAGAWAEEVPGFESLVESNTDFGLRLYGQLRATPGNLILSPYSISSALAMTCAGARLETARQMEQALGFGTDMAGMSTRFGRLRESIEAAREEGGIEISVANSLWPAKRYDFLEAFLGLIKTDFGASITPLDYAGSAEKSRGVINSWVDERTRHKISEIIPPGGIGGQTRLVLVNAIYFKGAWAQPFHEAQTRVEDFHVTAAIVVNPAFMHQTTDFGYAAGDQFQMLVLPYHKNRMEMLVLLPRKQDGVGELEASLTPAALREWRSSVRRQKVVVSLPKFKITTGFGLVQPLQALGMTDAFSAGRADFSGMDGRAHWLYLSSVVHKAFIEVNESGTEAAAATAATMRATGMRREAEPKVFRADHPFLFVIRDSLTGSILFLGRVAQPAG